MSLFQDIYDSLTGQFEEGLELPWVPNAFADGSPCERAYREMLAVRDRIQDRLGGSDDADLEQIRMQAEVIQYELCMAIMKLRRF